MRVIDWWFRDRRTGRLTIAQLPNLPLGLFLVASAVGLIVGESSDVGTAASVLGTAALTWWGIDEVTRGVNPWRRLLGVVGLVFVVTRIVRAL